LILAGVDGGQNGGTQVQLVKMRDAEHVLATADFPWEFGRTYILALEVEGKRVRGYVGDALLFDVMDEDADALGGGGVALVATEGRTATQAVRVTPLA
jgi:hypothetical protein